MKWTVLPQGSIWWPFEKKATAQRNIKTIKTFAPVSGLCFSPFNQLYWCTSLCRREKKKNPLQLVTPYGRERRGRFEHLPAWTRPYAVEFARLLSLVNEKSDALFLLLQFLTCFLRYGRQRHTSLPTPLGSAVCWPIRWPSLISFIVLGAHLHEFPLRWLCVILCLWSHRTEGDSCRSSVLRGMHLRKHAGWFNFHKPPADIILVKEEI